MLFRQNILDSTRLSKDNGFVTAVVSNIEKTK
jgi:hypothetical protein